MHSHCPEWLRIRDSSGDTTLCFSVGLIQYPRYLLSPPHSPYKARADQYTWCLGSLPRLDPDGNFQQPPKPHTLLNFCLLSQWWLESARVCFDFTVFRVYFNVADQWCFGLKLELALLHPPHYHRLVLRPEPGAGSPFRVGLHHSHSRFQMQCGGLL